MECNSNYVLDLFNSMCVLNTTSNCRRMHNGNCTNCDAGYYLELDTTSLKIYCYEESSSVENCDTYINKGSSCKTCISKYYFDGTSCTACPTGCSKCTSSTICTSCDKKYTLISNKCVACTSLYCDTCLST